MGNCVMRNRSILVQNEKENHPREAEAIERRIDVHGGKKKKKTVRFRFNEEDDADKERNGYSKNGAVRIRVVVTQREFIQILRSESKYSSVEQLLKTMKLKTKKISHVRTSDERTNRGWRPALESIPEDVKLALSLLIVMGEAIRITPQ
ncbi:hypothetical protein Acr_00g0017790 [Actinidia rufa]|uniref:Uncharacterized protein n=1 Tax=Actinidia rufa TaxID=165716 RepID=A0A7J0DB95_9ERIC|nr:hypothetical protein Acr_00g0017790 [Actinidia rufa]